MIQTLVIEIVRVIKKNRNDPDSVTDTVRVINKHGMIQTLSLIQSNKQA